MTSFWHAQKSPHIPQVWVLRGLVRAFRAGNTGPETQGRGHGGRTNWAVQTEPDKLGRTLAAMKLAVMPGSASAEGQRPAAPKYRRGGMCDPRLAFATSDWCVAWCVGRLRSGRRSAVCAGQHRTEAGCRAQVHSGTERPGPRAPVSGDDAGGTAQVCAAYRPDRASRPDRSPTSRAGGAEACRIRWLRSGSIRCRTPRTAPSQPPAQAPGYQRTPEGRARAAAAIWACAVGTERKGFYSGAFFAGHHAVSGQ